MREREDEVAVGELFSCIAVYRMRLSSERLPAETCHNAEWWVP
jgi:hypothetical protein